MALSSSRLKSRLLAAVAATAVGGGALFVAVPASDMSANGAPAAAVAQAIPASVARVQRRDVAKWVEFSGRLEAVERVEVRARVSGAVDAIHFREGALVAKGDPLLTIDPAPYQAEVDRARAQVASAEARIALAKADLERGQKMTRLETISQRDLDVRVNALREAQASEQGARAALKIAELNLGYTEVRAPVSGRVGRIEVTVGNLIAAGPGAPVLTHLVSVDPIYASFDADERSVLKALESLPAGLGDVRDGVGSIPVEMATDSAGSAVRGSLQYMAPVVDAAAGTVRVRAAFANPQGRLMPGQFARLKMGQAKPESAVLVSDRAVGVDQDKTFVFVVGDDDKAAWREVKLGAAAEGLRIVLNGLEPGERVVVNGFQHVKPGAPIAPEPVAMDGSAAAARQASNAE
jgi:multidrug efflux system membrane fusion protein